MNIKAKKTMFIIALIITLASCGGGSGGNGGNGYTQNPAPSKPSNPGNGLYPPNGSTDDDDDDDTDYGSGIRWNDKKIRYDENNPHNKTSSSSSYDGTGVAVGVIDVGFNTDNYKLKSDMRNKFGNRLEKIYTPNVTTDDEYHGILVSEMIGGNTKNGTAKNVKIYAADSSQLKDNGTDTYPKPTVSMYNKIYAKGVKIFNQSYGVNRMVTEYSSSPYSLKYYKDQIENDFLDFYNKAVNEGALFMWAAGNNEDNDQPNLEAGLPYFERSLEKGWISVVGLSTKDSDNLGDISWDNLQALSSAGVGKNWTVSAIADYKYEINGKSIKAAGSSFATPVVTGTAAMIKQKYPWMDGNLIKQTILSTATDIGEKGVDEIYGWGLLNIDKALKGPALFDKRLALGDDVYITLDGRSKPYEFDNDISGDAGLVLRGSGTLILNGAATYTGETNVGNNVYLKIKRMNSPSTLSIGKEAIVEVSSSTINNIQNDGTFINNGNSIANNVVMTNESKMYSDINANLKATNAEVNGIVTVTNNNGEYLTKNGKNIDIITGNVTGNSEIKSDNGLMTVNKIKTENLSANISRTDTIEYAKSLNSDTEQLNTARQIETALENVDKNYESGKKEAGILGSKLQTLNLNTLDSMSGQIYASAQALTFEQSETVNKNLSNRISMLSKSMENSDKKFGFWTSGIFSKGNIKKDGFAKGNTSVKGGQIGFDMKISPDAILGISADYSKGKVKFNRYNGQSKADMTGLSLYGRQNLGNSYIAGRAGIGFADSRVERDIIVNNNYIEHSKVSHNDNIISGYFETGYDIKNKEGDFAVTPYAALGMDKVTRGKFSEENTNFGMKADKKSYNMPYASIGIKTVKTFGKTDITGYAGYTQGLNKKNLDFEASYNFAPDAKFKVKGINYSRNKINAGIGVNTEIKNGASWYANYDYKHSTDKSKADNHMITTGIRFEF